MLYRTLDNDKPQEECGVIAIYGSAQDNIIKSTLYGLQALQHRGQESCGLAYVTTKNTKNKIQVTKKMGLVAQAFDKSFNGSFEYDFDARIQDIQAINLSIGHVRYSTMGSSDISAAQPIFVDTAAGGVALAHNGTISNAAVLREFLEDIGESFESDSDSEIITALIRRKAKHGFPKALGKAVSMLQGSYSMVCMTEASIIGIKDPYGIRPLCLGSIEDNNHNKSFVIASESCALDAIGATYIREIEAGEIITIDKEGVHSYNSTEKNAPSPCSFEQIYFSRPDSIVGGKNVYEARLKAGKFLHKQNPVEADVVVGVPQSGLPAATGYSEASGIPHEMALVKNPYILRSFTKPSLEQRIQIIRAKFNVVTNLVKGKRVVVVDDSLVRGTTSTILIAILREHGAKEVHFRSASPPVKFPCYFGIDISKRKELMASNSTCEEICKSIGADSLDFLSVENLKKSLNLSSHCVGCFTGVYPTYAPMEQEN